MEQFQLDGYNNALKNKKDVLERGSSAASMFVFPGLVLIIKN